MGNCQCILSQEKNHSNVFLENLENKIIPINLADSTSSKQEKKALRGNNPSQASFKKKKTPTNDNVCENKEDTSQLLNFSCKIHLQNLKKDIINIVLLGESGVGKSSFAIKQVENKFEQFHVVSITIEESQKLSNYKHTKFFLQFTAFPGKSEYWPDDKSAYKNADFFLLMYDVTDKKSLMNLSVYLKEIKPHLSLYPDSKSTPNVIFVGNKSDVKNAALQDEDIDKFSNRDPNFLHFKISVKTGLGVSNLIEKILEPFHEFLD